MAAQILDRRVLCTLGIILIGIAFSGAEKDLLVAWQTEEYSHGFFIPPIAALLFGHLLQDSPGSARPSWWGLLFFALSAFLLLITRLSAFEMSADYGLVTALAGLSLISIGFENTRRSAPAIVYLLFAIPLPHLFQANLSQNLQLISSYLGVWPLDAVGIPVFQEGNIIDLGGFRLQVVDACSGLRYLFPLMSFGYLVAALLKDKTWKRILIIISTIPISIGLNALRITIIGISVDLWGQKMAEGFIHAFEGWAVFMICLGLLLVETSLLMKVGSKKGVFRYDYLTIPKGPFFTSVSKSAIPGLVALMILLPMVFIFGPLRNGSFTEQIPAHPPFSSFPTALADWRGRQAHLAPEILSALQLSDYWLGDYSRLDQPDPVNFYMAYYASQRVGVTTHSPSNCIPGGGWQITDSSIVAVPLAEDGMLSVSRLVIRKDHASQLVYYWFDERGRDLTETTYAKWFMMVDSIKMHRTDGALVRLVTPFEGPEGEKAADSRLKDFLAAAYPSIKAFIPGAKPAI